MIWWANYVWLQKAGLRYARSAKRKLYEDGDRKAMQEEAVQCAAMCFRFLAVARAEEIIEDDEADHDG